MTHSSNLADIEGGQREGQRGKGFKSNRHNKASEFISQPVLHIEMRERERKRESRRNVVKLAEGTTHTLDFREARKLGRSKECGKGTYNTNSPLPRRAVGEGKAPLPRRAVGEGKERVRKGEILRGSMKNGENTGTRALTSAEHTSAKC